MSNIKNLIRLSSFLFVSTIASHDVTCIMCVPTFFHNILYTRINELKTRKLCEDQIFIHGAHKHVSSLDGTESKFFHLKIFHRSTRSTHVSTVHKEMIQEKIAEALG